MAIFLNHFTGKSLQHRFVGNVTDKVVTVLLVDHAHLCTGLAEFLGNTKANPLSSAGHHHALIFEIDIPFPVNDQYTRKFTQSQRISPSLFPKNTCRINENWQKSKAKQKNSLRFSII